MGVLKLYVDDVAHPEMIDDVWRIDKSAPERPFQNLDRIGLKTVYGGRLGHASGEGFYKYSERPASGVGT